MIAFPLVNCAGYTVAPHHRVNSSPSDWDWKAVEKRNGRIEIGAGQELEITTTRIADETLCILRDGTKVWVEERYL